MKLHYNLSIDAADRSGKSLGWKVERYNSEEGSWVRILDGEDEVIAEIPLEEWDTIGRVLHGIDEWIASIEQDNKPKMEVKP